MKTWALTALCLALGVCSAASPTESAQQTEGWVPQSDAVRAVPFQQGLATWYGGKRWHGRRTASGERFDRHALTAAHPRLPFGTRVKVVNPSNGREVVVRINDRGPHGARFIIDLSEAAAEQLGFRRKGWTPVVLHDSAADHLSDMPLTHP